jgi:hypothetical protein
MAERSRLAQEAEASRQEAESLRGELVALRVTCLEVEGRLAAQVEAATRLERSLGEARTAGNVERENLKRRLAEREAELEGLSEVAWRSDRARRRWTALAAGGSLVAAGIIAAVVAARAPVMAVEPGTKVLAASEAEGYRKALVALAAEASRMEADGDRGGALVAWRSISAISTDTGLSAHAEERVQELSAAEVPARVTHDGAPEANLSAERFRAAPVVRSARMEASPDGAGGPRERRAVGRSQTVRQVEKPRPARARPAPARGIDGGGEIVPADVRAKILELP